MPPPPPQGPPPPFQYQQPYFTTPPHHPPPIHHRPTSLLLSFSRHLTLLVPGIILILNIWWAATERVCPRSASAGALCFWLLWLTLPIATVSFIWAIAESISARRATHHLSHIPRAVDVVVRAVLAVGVTVCLVLLVYHMVRWDVWSVSAEAAMVALLAIMLCVDGNLKTWGSWGEVLLMLDRVTHWTLFAWAAFELKRTRQEQHYRDSHIGI